MRIPCGCEALWLTSVSEPITAEQAVAQPCPCCAAPAGRRCEGALAGWLPTRQGREGQQLGERKAYVFVCPARLEVQATLELAA